MSRIVHPNRVMVVLRDLIETPLYTNRFNDTKYFRWLKKMDGNTIYYVASSQNFTL